MAFTRTAGCILSQAMPATTSWPVLSQAETIVGKRRKAIKYQARIIKTPSGFGEVTYQGVTRTHHSPIGVVVLPPRMCLSPRTPQVRHCSVRSFPALVAPAALTLIVAFPTAHARPLGCVARNTI